MESAVERKLRPIYEALDSKNWKLSLKLLTNALQKHPKHQLLRVLKALALQKFGRTDEAREVCDEIARETPTESQVLYTLGQVYKSLKQPQAMVAVYEAASAAHPKDFDLLKGLFGTYTRELDFGKQGQVAMRLMRQAGPSLAPKYLWWLVLSYVLQVRAARSAGAEGPAGTLAPDKLLQLAESMAAKQVAKAGSLGSLEALLVYLDILQAQGKWQAALEVVEGPLGDVISLPAERLSLRACLLVVLGRRTEAAGLFREALAANPDDWGSLQRLLDCLLPRSKRAGCGSGAGVLGVVGGLAHLTAALQAEQQDDTLDEAEGLKAAEAAIAALQAPQTPATPEQTSSSGDAATEGSRTLSTGTPPRGPVLAAVELALRKLHLRRLKFAGAMAGGGAAAAGAMANGYAAKAAEAGRAPDDDAGDDSRELAAAVLEYFRRQGHVVSCAVDLRSYVAQVKGPSCGWLATALHAECTARDGAAWPGSQAEPDAGQEGNGSGGSEKRATIQALRRRVCAHQIESELGLPDYSSAQEAEEAAAQLLAGWAATRHLSQHLDPKDRGAADDLIPLAATALMRARSLESSGGAVGGGGAAVKRMVQALLVLEAGQVSRPVSAMMRLPACGLYGLLAAPAPAAAALDALGVKHIMHDTLTGHLLLPAALGLGGPGGPAALQAIQQLHADHQRTFGETLMDAYDKGTYSKVPEFFGFQERMARSHTLATAAAETAIHSITSAAAAGPRTSPAAVRDTAAAAAAELSATAPDDDPLTERGAAGLRFNEDLATRAAWLQPSEGEVRLAVAEWWGSAAEQPIPGFAQCWWAAPGAAEAAGSSAEGMRGGLRRALRGRWLVPRLLAGAMLQPGSTGEYAGDVELLCRSLGLETPVLDSTLAARPWQAPLHPIPATLQLLRLALFAAGQPIRVLLLPPQPPTPAADSSAAQPETEAANCEQAAALAAERLGAVTQLVAVLAERVAGGLLGGGSVGNGGEERNGEGRGADDEALPALLPGGAVVAAVALVGEDLLWVILCFQAWAAALQALQTTSTKKPKGKKSAAAVQQQAPRPDPASLKPALAELQAALHAGLAAVQAAKRRCLAVPENEQVARLEALVGVGDAAVEGKLWGVEPKLDARLVLEGLVKSQREALDSLSGVLTARVGLLTTVQL